MNSQLTIVKIFPPQSMKCLKCLHTLEILHHEYQEGNSIYYMWLPHGNPFLYLICVTKLPCMYLYMITSNTGMAYTHSAFSMCTCGSTIMHNIYHLSATN